MDEVRTKLTQGGRVVIPATYRRALGIVPGDEVLLRIIDGEIRMLSRAEAIRRAQAMVRRHVKKTRSLVRELREERRAEAENE
jgi:AbrB family looped-hinge helix DNA binding protein